MRRLTALAGLTLALCAIGPGLAAAQYFGQNKIQYRQHKWKSISADHFEVYFYGGLDSLAMRVLDLAEKSHEYLSRRMGHSLGRRVPIILYGSHNDFAQTNVTPELIDGSTGGFTEALRNRVVLPFTGSYEDLRHVVVHELVHAVMFDLLYGGSAASLLAQQSFFSVPLWFAEGMAEYYSLGFESTAEMVMRDGTIEGYLPPLEYSGGYTVYKQGQTAVGYLVDRFGEERLRDLLQRIRSMRSFERAFQRSVDMSPRKFDEQWREALKKRFWPGVAKQEDPDQIARRLTDHRRDESNLNTSPSISPQGDRIAYFSDRRQYTDVYLMSAFDGKVLRRLIRGERNVAFENIPSLRSSITWSPDGERLALTAKSAGRDLIYILSAETGKVIKRFDLQGCDALSYPAWSPVSDSLVVAGLQDGRSDLWLLDIGTGEYRRLTDDAWDEKEPTWTPDGTAVTFSSDRGAPVVLHPVKQPGGYGRYGIYQIRLSDRAIAEVLDTAGDDHSPAWSPDGTKLAFISDRSLTPNMYLYDLRDSVITRLTDVTGAVSSLTWSRENDRLVFSAFNHGGFDVFAVREPVAVDAVLAHIQRRMPEAVLSVNAASAPAPDSTSVPGAGLLATHWADSLSLPHDTLRTAPVSEEPRVAVSGARDSTAAELGRPVEPPSWSGGEIRAFPPAPDSIPPLAITRPLIERGGPFALPDTVLGQTPTPYRVRLAPDYAGANVYAASGYGFGGQSQFALSDFLGDHSVYIAANVFSTSLEDLNALVLYNYLPRRWDLGVGVFHSKNYLSSTVTSLGEPLGRPRDFSERNYGGLVSASYPFHRFQRMEIGFLQSFVERTFYDRDEFGQYFAAGTEFRSVSSPTLSLVGDNALFGYYGPVNGQRYTITYSPSFAWFANGVNYQTGTADLRRYVDLTHGYTFATRILAGASGGEHAQVFRVGGFSTLRGYDDFSLVGSRVVILNSEFRFPFIHQLGLVGPLPVGVFNLRGVGFLDAGLVWNQGDPLRFTRVVQGSPRLESPRMGFGTGIRSSIFYMILKLDVAWNTDLRFTSAPHWYFSIGPEF